MLRHDPPEQVAMALSFMVDHGKIEGKSIERSIAKIFPECPSSPCNKYVYLLLPSDLLYDSTAVSFTEHYHFKCVQKCETLLQSSKQHIRQFLRVKIYTFHFMWSIIKCMFIKLANPYKY